MLWQHWHALATQYRIAYLALQLLFRKGKVMSIVADINSFLPIFKLDLIV